MDVVLVRLHGIGLGILNCLCLGDMCFGDDGTANDASLIGIRQEGTSEKHPLEIEKNVSPANTMASTV